jgi:hypothetical protein
VGVLCGYFSSFTACVPCSAAGVGFRFEDVKVLMYHEVKAVHLPLLAATGHVS